jgi:hypothetical protein
VKDKPATSPNPATERKAESNRRNSRKSTGPKTARGKARSRLNALKHGVLASQAVITTVEGKLDRKAFEEMVDGFARDFAPVGTFEQVLVEQIAACVWRQRRLLMFENRARVQARDNRTFREMNEPPRGVQPRYLIEEDRVEGPEVLEVAGLGLDPPSERDTMRLIRYENSITRSLRNALAQLKARQQARRAAEGEAAIEPAYEHRAVVVDSWASKRNRGPEARALPAKTSLFANRMEMEEQAEEEQRQREDEAAEAAAATEATEVGETAASSTENDQTKPNSPEDPKVLASHARLLESADAVLKLRASLAPKRRPSED